MRPAAAIAVAAGAAVLVTLTGAATPPQGLEETYRRFSRAYEILAPDSIAELYTEQALYLAPGEDVRRGRAAVREIFAGFFDDVRARGRRLRIGFEIVDRGIEGALAYDVGYYDLTTFVGDRVVGRDRGKFTGVLRRGRDGVWRFHVDSYSSVPTARQ